MKLEITANDTKQEKLGVYVLNLKEFKMKEYHPFLATQRWERVDIDLTDETPRGLIRQLIKSNQIVPHFDKENITRNIMYLLCEIAVDDTAKLRSYYSKDKQLFKKALEEIIVKYNWEETKSELS